MAWGSSTGMFGPSTFYRSLIAMPCHPSGHRTQQNQPCTSSQVFRAILQRLCAARAPDLNETLVRQRATSYKSRRPILTCACMQTVGGAYVLIDFEHSGLVDAVPRYEPLRHWPKECRRPARTVLASCRCIQRWASDGRIQYKLVNCCGQSQKKTDACQPC